MSTKYCADALEWWITNQGKFIGASVGTSQIMIFDKVTGNETGATDQFEITEWNVPGVDQPSDDQINQIISDYSAAMAQVAINDAVKRQALLTKLGITQDDFNLLIS